MRAYFSGRVISAGEQISLAIARGDVALAALKRIEGRASSLAWDVRYCSVFDKCWTSSSAGHSWLQESTLIRG